MSYDLVFAYEKYLLTPAAGDIEYLTTAH